MKHVILCLALIGASPALAHPAAIHAVGGSLTGPAIGLGLVALACVLATVSTHRRKIRVRA